LFGIIAYAARESWLAELLVHFRLQYVVLGMVLALLLLWRRRPMAAIIGLAASLASAPAVAKTWAESGAIEPAPDTAAQAWRIAASNVWLQNREFATVRAWAESQQADVLVLIETNDRWAAEFATLHTQFPYQARLRAPGTSDMLVLSRVKIAAQRELRATGTHALGLALTLERSGRRLDLLALHAWVPVTPSSAVVRNAELQRIAGVARLASTPLLAIGDLNVTPYSPNFTELLRTARLHSATQGRLWTPTWPSLFLPLGIQIDHALANKWVRFESWRTARIPRSDHRAVIVDIRA
jgi:endonuclease/exonuclease/phosphatase (EEP) superfamily protein YafD